jgi:hypothetical protein
MSRSIVFGAVFVVFAIGSLAAQDKSSALEKAKTDFQKEIKRVDDNLLKYIDKTIVNETKKGKTGNKDLIDKLNYFRPLFISQHFAPPPFPDEYYQKQRTDYILARARATEALLKAYKPVLDKLRDDKKVVELEAHEDALDELLKASRGYGLAIPDLEKNPTQVYLIVNAEHDRVIEPIDTGLALTPKLPKPKPSQCWQFEREERGFVIRNVGNGSAIHVSYNGDGAGLIVTTFPIDKTKDAPTSSVYRLNSIRREMVIERCEPELILTATEKKIKGTSIFYVTQEKKNDMPSKGQLWKLEAVK